MNQFAMNGGIPVYSGSFPGWPQWGAKEKENLLNAVDSGSWGTLGRYAMSFSRRFADYTGVSHAIAVNNGTQALELILRSAHIGREDEVIVSPYSFAATVSAVAFTGAMPVFADVDPRTGNIDAEAANKCITTRTRAIIAVHTGGYPCDMDALKMIADKHGLLLIEDCAHAHGSAWRGKMCGCLGDAAAFSFQGREVLNCGEGGMITTNSEELFNRCWQFHHSGRVQNRGEKLGGTTLMGTNGRMAEWEAAVLDAQLDRLPDQCAHRQVSIRQLMKDLASVPGIELPPEDKRITALSGSFFQFQWTGAMDRADFIRAVRAEGIPCCAGYFLLSKMGMLSEPAFERMTGRRYKPQVCLPAAESLTKKAVWIPNNVLLADEEVISKVVEAIRKIAHIAIYNQLVELK